MNISPVEMIVMLEQLLGRARGQGFLTVEQIIRFFPKPEQNVALIDQLYAALGAEGITIIDPHFSTNNPVSISAEDDHSKFTDLYKSRRNYLLSIAVRILQDQSLAEDVAQETLLIAWIYRRLEDSPGVVRWLSIIARNKSIDIIRSRNRRHIPLEHVRHNYSIENAVINHVHLTNALNTLPTLQRRTIDLVYYEGLPVVTAAARLDESQNTVFSRKRLALSKLREVMGEDI